MADTDEKTKSQRPPSAEQLVKAGKDEKKAAKQAKADKAAADSKAGKPAAPREPEPRVPARLKVEFEGAIRGKLAEQFGYKNRMQIPVLDKVVINMGIGEGVADRKKVRVAKRSGAEIDG